VENVELLADEIVNHMFHLSQYNLEIIFVDNCSDDGTQDVLRHMCANDKRIKAVFNVKNYATAGSFLNVLYYAKGDCIITIPADFQVPIELIGKMINEWENGAVVIALTKTAVTKDAIWFIRKIFYSINKRLTTHGSLSGFNGSGAYDSAFIDMCKSCKDPLLNLRYMAANHAAPLVCVPYVEQPRRAGVSKFNASLLLDVALKGHFRASDVIPKYAVQTGLMVGGFSFLISIYYLVRKLIDWQNFPIGIAPLIIGMFFLGAIQLIFLGLIGEYILAIDKRQRNEPRVVVKEFINFDEEDV